MLNFLDNLWDGIIILAAIVAIFTIIGAFLFRNR